MQNYQLKFPQSVQILLIILFIGCNGLNAQHDIKMINATIFDSEEYKDYKGTPYLWKENKEVIIIDNKGTDYNSVMGNYHGIDQEFEVYEDNTFIRLPHSQYISIKVINDPEVSYSLFSNVHSKLKNKYCILHEQKPNYRIFESFIPKVSVVKLETPGKATEFNKIKARSKYYIVSGSHLIPFKIKKKHLIKQFGHKKEINKFLKENKIKIKKIEDVLVLFEYLDSNGWLIP